MCDPGHGRAIENLPVEDSPGDAALISETMTEANLGNRLRVVEGGHTAISFLKRRPPHAAAPGPGRSCWISTRLTGTAGKSWPRQRRTIG